MNRKILKRWVVIIGAVIILLALQVPIERAINSTSPPVTSEDWANAAIPCMIGLIVIAIGFILKSD